MFSMIIVRMGLSMAWQNSSQSRSSLTTLRYNRQLATPPQPQNHFMHSIGMNMTTTTVDESQSMGKIGAQSDFKRKSFLPTWTASGENGMVPLVIFKWPMLIVINRRLCMIHDSRTHILYTTLANPFSWEFNCL